MDRELSIDSQSSCLRAIAPAIAVVGSSHQLISNPKIFFRRKDGVVGVGGASALTEATRAEHRFPTSKYI
jgi:hypothetical protein